MVESNPSSNFLANIGPVIPQVDGSHNSLPPAVQTISYEDQNALSSLQIYLFNVKPAMRSLKQKTSSITMTMLTNLVVMNVLPDSPHK
jgi:hypothetical protein